MNQLGPLLIPKATIAQKIAELAIQINQDFLGKSLVLVIVLKGAICFAADLMRQLSIPFTLECIQAGSYGMRGTKPKGVSILSFKTLDLKGKDILVIDDICDTGKTLEKILVELAKYSPKSLQTLVLLNKQVAGKAYISDYHLFDIDDYFVVGYGLDYREQFRALPEIYVLKETS